MTSRSATVSFNPPGNGAMYFDGTGDYLSIPASSEFDLTTNNTLEAWVYCTTGVAQGVMSYSTTAAPISGNQVSYIWFITVAGTLRFDVNGTGGTTETTITTATIPSNTWTHIAVVKNGTSVTQYINGVSSSTATFSGAGNATSAAWSFRVGTYYTTALSFNGYIDEARVTKGVARYTSNFTVPSEPFSENTTIDPYYNNVSLLLHGNGVNTSTNFIDSSPAPKTISVFGNARISTTQSKFTSSAGISGYIVTSVPGGITATGVSSPITVNGLDNGKEYTFNVRATSSGGNGLLSALSNKLIPVDIDPYYSSVSLLLHGDGTNGSSSFIDSSSSPKSVTSVGSAQISTTKSKFGGSSMYFNGSNYATIPTNTAFDFGTNDFTLEAFVNLPTITGYKIIIGRQEPSNGMALQLWVNNNTAGVSLRTQGGGTVYSVTSAAALTTDTWTHIAGVRHGSLLYIFINGTLSGSATIPAVTLNCSRPLTIGVLDDTLLGAYYTGYIDEVRITTGVARYTQNFAVPAAAYPSAKSSKDPYYNSVSLLLHGDGLNNGTAIYDSSLVPKTATNSAVTTVNTSPYFGSGSLKFTSSSYLEYASNTAFSPSTGNFAVECFVLLTSYNGSGSYVYTRFNPAVLNTDEFNLGIGAAGYIFAGWDYPGNIFGVRAMSASAVVPLNTRTHIAVVKYDLKLMIFVNGALVTSATATAHPPTSAQKVTIGNFYSGNATYGIIGRLEEFRITKGFARYTSTFSVPTDSLPDVLPTPDPYYRNTSLILHGNGVNGTSNFIDNSPLTGTLTASGSITHTTTNKKFGMSSINVPDKNSKIQVVKSVAVDLTGTYTIEFWARTSTAVVGDANAVISTNDNVYPNRLMVDFYAPNSTTILGRIATTSNAIIYTSPTQPYVLGDWAHFAFVNNSTANTHTVFINGVVAGSRAAVPLFNTTTFQVGKNSAGWAEGPYQIDDLKITNGVAKYSANFLVPTLEDAYYDTNFSSVSLLLHGTGPNGSTVITDNSLVSKPVTVFGNASISTSQSKFGGSSMYFDGNGDYLTIPDHSDFAFGGSDFTIEAWVYTAASVTGTQVICGQWNTSLSWVLSISTNNTLVFESSTTGAYLGTRDVISLASAVPVSTWAHVAATRNGDVFKLFINGVSSTTVTIAGALFDSSESITVGRGASGLQYFSGYIDELRITKGLARYTSNFTVPTAPFPDQ